MHSLGVSLEELYQVFNMGIGMVIIVPDEDSQDALNIIDKYNPAYKIGKVEGAPEKISLKTYQGNIIYI
jgi:phosphoribosylformylglycinamidine cyclo-ligase